MTPINITVHRAPDGKLTTVEAGEDARKVIEAFHECGLPGEVTFYGALIPNKIRKVKAIPNAQPDQKPHQPVKAALP